MKKRVRKRECRLRETQVNAWLFGRKKLKNVCGGGYNTAVITGNQFSSFRRIEPGSPLDVPLLKTPIRDR